MTHREHPPKKDEFAKIVALGTGSILIQCSEVELGENGPQVQIDFFQHIDEHPIGRSPSLADCNQLQNWTHIAVIGSNRIESLDVLIEEITDARDKLKKHLPDGHAKEKV